MSSSLSVAEMLAHLQGKIAFHKEQRDLHARQEAEHAEQRALHEEEHRKAVERFEALQAASAAAGELLVGAGPSGRRAAAFPEGVRSGGWRWVARLLESVIEAKAPGEVFSASTLIAEINELWSSKLRHGIDSRSAQVTLRRWAKEGRLEIVREGRSHHESQYARPRPAGGE